MIDFILIYLSGVLILYILIGIVDWLTEPYEDNNTSGAFALLSWVGIAGMVLFFITGVFIGLVGKIPAPGKITKKIFFKHKNK